MESGATQQKSITKSSISKPEVVKIEDQVFNVHFKVLTICVVTDKEGKQLGVGTTQWSPQDEFDYDRGKKLALREAIKSHNDNFRPLFWDSYLSGAREHLHNRIAQHRAAFKDATKLVKAIAFELNEDLLKLKRGVFGCERH